MAPQNRSSGLRGGSARYQHLNDHSEHPQNEWGSNESRHALAFKTSKAPSYQFSEDIPLLGKPARKKIFYISDIAMAIVALACLALSILVVIHSDISWYLGIDNRQLIVLGFLLSVMSQCLASVTPTLFILLEARFGKSTIQNYDAILRNKPLASRLSLAWRVVIVAMLALPIGLSVAYKTFAGGESRMNVHMSDYLTNTSHFGLFKPPGSASITGISLYLNATASFRDATERATNGSEPPLPTFPQPYGYNILLLNESSAALFDTLHPDYVLEIQNLLSVGESWTITAPIVGTVATLNPSATNDRRAFEEDFESICTEANGENNEEWEISTVYLYNEWSFTLANQRLHSDQSTQYISISPGFETQDCAMIAPYVQLYNIYRQPCLGTWSIGRGGFQLLSGSCDDTILPWAKQQIIQWQTLALQSWYMPSLIEMMQTFCGDANYQRRGNQSLWMRPYMTVSVATMLWSRITSLQSRGAPFNSETFNRSSEGWQSSNGTIIPHEEADIMYPIDEDDQTIIYNRPTLRKSPWLYLVLGVQPILLLIFLGMIALLHTVPLDKGFGLISILSGIERRGLDSLRGASLSGELKKPVKLTMSPVTPVQGDGESSIQYRIDPVSEKETKSNKRLSPNIVYH